MANASTALSFEPIGSGGKIIDLPVDGGSTIYAGTFVSQLAATGMAVPGSTSASGRAVGVAMHGADNSTGSDGDKRVQIMTERIFAFANGTSTDAFSEASLIGSTAYMYDDHTVYDNDAGGTLAPGGIFMGMEPDGKVRVYVHPFGAVSSDVGALTDSSGGTANGTLQAIGASYAQAEVANNFADVAAKINAIRTALRAAGLMA